MMKDKTKSIRNLKIEIEELDNKIEDAIKINKKAFAKRLKLIKDKKINLLNSWVQIS
jgi:hypothetical protein